jgi:myosin heavy subunit
LFLQEALDILRISKEDQEHTFAMLAAVLWLGNISFQVIDNENHVEVLANEGKFYVFGFMTFLMDVLHLMLFLCW